MCIYFADLSFFKMILLQIGRDNFPDPLPIAMEPTRGHIFIVTSHIQDLIVQDFK